VLTVGSSCIRAPPPCAHLFRTTEQVRPLAQTSIPTPHQCSAAVQAALGPERVGYQRGAFLSGWGGDGELDGAAFDCRNADACVVFLGLSALGVSDYHPPLYQEHVRSSRHQSVSATCSPWCLSLSQACSCRPGTERRMR